MIEGHMPMVVIYVVLFDNMLGVPSGYLDGCLLFGHKFLSYD